MLLHDINWNVMSQVLNRERMKEVSGLLQLLGICIGFAVMLVLEIYGRICCN